MSGQFLKFCFLLVFVQFVDMIECVDEDNESINTTILDFPSDSLQPFMEPIVSDPDFLVVKVLMNQC